jgi:hypothetical protein
VIVVVGRPGLDANDEIDQLAGLVALAAATAGAKVELVGSVGDDESGEQVALGLGKAKVGHAALIRDPAAVTPKVGAVDGPAPRLEREDVELGLSYIADYRVLVLAEAVDASVVEVAKAAAAFQGAAFVVVVATGSPSPPGLPPTATVLEAPAGDEGAFAALVGRYAASLDSGSEAASAWRTAVSATGWESVSGDGA